MFRKSEVWLFFFFFKYTLLQHIYFFKGMDFEEKKHGAERYGIENKYKYKLFC